MFIIQKEIYDDYSNQDKNTFLSLQLCIAVDRVRGEETFV